MYYRHRMWQNSFMIFCLLMKRIGYISIKIFHIWGLLRRTVKNRADNRKRWTGLILHQCKCPVLFYDEMQVVGPSGIDVRRFHKKMEIEQAKRMISYYNLLTQMRVNGGNDYIAYVKIFYQAMSEKRKHLISMNLNWWRILRHLINWCTKRRKKYSL